MDINACFTTTCCITLVFWIIVHVRFGFFDKFCTPIRLILVCTFSRSDKFFTSKRTYFKFTACIRACQTIIKSLEFFCLMDQNISIPYWMKIQNYSQIRSCLPGADQLPTLLGFRSNPSSVGSWSAPGRHERIWL